MAPSDPSTMPDEDLVTDFRHLGIAVTRKEPESNAGVPLSLPPSQIGEIPFKHPRKAPVFHAHGPVMSSHRADGASAVPTTTDIQTRISEPVVHEVVKVVHHEIRQEVIHKDIHQHHQVTRILPIVEQEMLPARHFLKLADGRKMEIPPPQLASDQEIASRSQLPIQQIKTSHRAPQQPVAPSQHSKSAELQQTQNRQLNET